MCTDIGEAIPRQASIPSDCATIPVIVSKSLTIAWLVLWLGLPWPTLQPEIDSEIARPKTDEDATISVSGLANMEVRVIGHVLGSVLCGIVLTSVDHSMVGNLTRLPKNSIGDLTNAG